MFADELLDTARALTGVDALSFEAAPVRFDGGYFTENHGFSLLGAPPPWDGPLVVRLFPSSMPLELVRVEVTVQRTVAEQGFATPSVVAFDETAHLAGRRFLVMERLPGAAMLAGAGLGTVLRHGPRLVGDLARTTAELQVALHRLDPEPVREELGPDAATVDRWFRHLRERIEAGAHGFSAGLDWLVANRPKDGDVVLCHGDLWPGNILVEGTKVSGVLDWTVATVAPPALDVGYTAMAFDLAPIEAPRPIQRMISRAGRAITRRYVRAYRQLSPVDLSTRPYYEALRCASELANVADRRLSPVTDAPVPTWASVVPAMVDYFAARTGGVRLDVPPQSG
jgi:aminoglycoside phosphotransferase (APT) family kinase protein